MGRIKCMVCGQDVSGRGKCPNCGFPVYYTTGQETTEIVKKVETLAKRHRYKQLDQLFISLYSCSYTMKNGTLQLKEEEWIPLIDGRELFSGKEKWLERKFARQRLDQPVYLKLKIKWFEEEKIKEVVIKPPIIFDFWRIGVRVSDESNIQILIGREDCWESSEKVSIF